MAELLTINLAANETKAFRKAGSYLEIIDSSYPVGLNLYSVNGSQIDSINGALSGFFLGVSFGAFDLKNGAISQTVTILALDPGEIGGSRRQPGVVRVIDQGYEKTNAALQFYGTATQSAFAATLSSAGIKAGAKRIAIKRIGIITDIAQSIHIGIITGDPTTGTWTAALNWKNKLLQSTDSLALKFYQQSVGGSWSGTELPGFVAITSTALGAAQSKEMLLTSPLVIQPGGYFVARGMTVNAMCGIEIDFEELTA